MPRLMTTVFHRALLHHQLSRLSQMNLLNRTTSHHHQRECYRSMTPRLCILMVRGEGERERERESDRENSVYINQLPMN